MKTTAFASFARRARLRSALGLCVLALVASSTSAPIAPARLESVAHADVASDIKDKVTSLAKAAYETLGLDRVTGAFDAVVTRATALVKTGGKVLASFFEALKEKATSAFERLKQIDFEGFLKSLGEKALALLGMPDKYENRVLSLIALEPDDPTAPGQPNAASAQLTTGFLIEVFESVVWPGITSALLAGAGAAVPQGGQLAAAAIIATPWYRDDFKAWTKDQFSLYGLRFVRRVQRLYKGLRKFGELVARAAVHGAASMNAELGKMSFAELPRELRNVLPKVTETLGGVVGAVFKYALENRPSLKAIVTDVVDGATGALDAFHDGMDALRDAAAAIGDPSLLRMQRDAAAAKASPRGIADLGARSSSGAYRRAEARKTPQAPVPLLARMPAMLAARAEAAAGRYEAAFNGGSPCAPGAACNACLDRKACYDLDGKLRQGAPSYCAALVDETLPAPDRALRVQRAMFRMVNGLAKGTSSALRPVLGLVPTALNLALSQQVDLLSRQLLSTAARAIPEVGGSIGGALHVVTGLFFRALIDQVPRILTKVMLDVLEREVRAYECFFTNLWLDPNPAAQKDAAGLAGLVERFRGGLEAARLGMKAMKAGLDEGARALLEGPLLRLVYDRLPPFAPDIAAAVTGAFEAAMSEMFKPEGFTFDPKRITSEVLRRIRQPVCRLLFRGLSGRGDDGSGICAAKAHARAGFAPAVLGAGTGFLAGRWAELAPALVGAFNEAWKQVGEKGLAGLMEGAFLRRALGDFLSRAADTVGTLFQEWMATKSSVAGPQCGLAAVVSRTLKDVVVPAVRGDVGAKGQGAEALFRGGLAGLLNALLRALAAPTVEGDPPSQSPLGQFLACAVPGTAAMATRTKSQPANALDDAMLSVQRGVDAGQGAQPKKTADESLAGALGLVLQAAAPAIGAVLAEKAQDTQLAVDIATSIDATGGGLVAGVADKIREGGWPYALVWLATNFRDPLYDFAFRKLGFPECQAKMAAEKGPDDALPALTVDAIVGKTSKGSVDLTGVLDLMALPWARCAWKEVVKELGDNLPAAEAKAQLYADRLAMLAGRASLDAKILTQALATGFKEGGDKLVEKLGACRLTSFAMAPLQGFGRCVVAALGSAVETGETSAVHTAVSGLAADVRARKDTIKALVDKLGAVLEGVAKSPGSLSRELLAILPDSAKAGVDAAAASFADALDKGEKACNALPMSADEKLGMGAKALDLVKRTWECVRCAGLGAFQAGAVGALRQAVLDVATMARRRGPELGAKVDGLFNLLGALVPADPLLGGLARTLVGLAQAPADGAVDGAFTFFADGLSKTCAELKPGTKAPVLVTHAIAVLACVKDKAVGALGQGGVAGIRALIGKLADDVLVGEKRAMAQLRPIVAQLDAFAERGGKLAGELASAAGDAAATTFSMTLLGFAGNLKKWCKRLVATAPPKELKAVLGYVKDFAVAQASCVVRRAKEAFVEGVVDGIHAYVDDLAEIATTQGGDLAKRLDALSAAAKKLASSSVLATDVVAALSKMSVESIQAAAGTFRKRLTDPKAPTSCDLIQPAKGASGVFARIKDVGVRTFECVVSAGKEAFAVGGTAGLGALVESIAVIAESDGARLRGALDAAVAKVSALAGQAGGLPPEVVAILQKPSDVVLATSQLFAANLRTDCAPLTVAATPRALPATAKATLACIKQSAIDAYARGGASAFAAMIGRMVDKAKVDARAALSRLNAAFQAARRILGSALATATRFAQTLAALGQRELRSLGAAMAAFARGAAACPATKPTTAGSPMAILADYVKRAWQCVEAAASAAAR